MIPLDRAGAELDRPRAPAPATGRSSSARRAYLAHPMTSYATAYARAGAAALATLLPSWEVIDPEACGWASDADWARDWPRILAGCSLVCVLPGPDGGVGAGCLREVADAIAREVPVLVLDKGDLVISRAGVWCLRSLAALILPRSPTPQLAAYVRGGPASMRPAFGRAKRAARTPPTTPGPNVPGGSRNPGESR